MKQQDSFGTLCSRLGVKFLGSSVKCVDAFRFALTENRSYLLNKNIAKTVNYLFFYHPLTLKTFSF